MKDLVSFSVSDRTMVGLTDGRWPMAMLALADAYGDANADADVSCHFRSDYFKFT